MRAWLMPIRKVPASTRTNSIPMLLRNVGPEGGPAARLSAGDASATPSAAASTQAPQPRFASIIPSSPGRRSRAGAQHREGTGILAPAADA